MQNYIITNKQLIFGILVTIFSIVYATGNETKDPVICVLNHYRNIQDLLRPGSFDLEKLSQAEKDGETIFPLDMILNLKKAKNIDEASDALSMIQRYQSELYSKEIEAVEVYLNALLLNRRKDRAFSLKW